MWTLNGFQDAYYWTGTAWAPALSKAAGADGSVFVIGTTTTGSGNHYVYRFTPGGDLESTNGTGLSLQASGGAVLLTASDGSIYQWNASSGWVLQPQQATVYGNVDTSSPITVNAGTTAVFPPGTVAISTNVTVDVGADAVVQGNVNAPVVVNGGTADIAPGSTVTGEVVIDTGQGTTDGTVNGNETVGGTDTNSNNTADEAGSGFIQGILSTGQPSAAGDAASDIGSFFSPGDSPGRLTVGGLVLNDVSEIQEQIYGPVAASSYSQITVNGSVTLAGATLSLDLGSYQPPVGQQFIVIDNEGGNPINGIFNGLPEGSFLTVSNTTFQVSYLGGSNHNDATLTVVAPLVAGAGGPYTITNGNPLTLNASPSADPNGGTLTYSWTINGNAGAVTGINPTLSWTALQGLGIAGTGSYPISVSVQDTIGLVSNDSATLLVVPPMLAEPTLTTSAGGPVVFGSGALLSASATLAGGAQPTGTITFTLTGPDGTVVDTEQVSVAGNGVYATPTGFVPTHAGAYDWTARYSGDNNNFPAADALDTTAVSTLTGLSDVYDIAFDSSGNRYVAESLPSQVAIFAPGSTTPTSSFSVYEPTQVAFDTSGDLFVLDGFDSEGTEYAPPGTTATETLSGLDGPQQMAFGTNGNLYVTNYYGNSVTVYAPGTSLPSKTLTGLDNPVGLAFDAAGNLYVANSGNDTVSVFSPGTTTPATTLTGLDGPSSLVLDGNGYLYVANYANNTVSIFSPGSLTPSSTLTGLNQPSSLAVDASGNLYEANRGSNTVEEFAPGNTTAIATISTGNQPLKLRFDPQGDLYVVNYGSASVSEFTPAAAPESALQATPTVTVSDGGGTYNGSPYAATNASVTGVGGDGALASFGSSTLSYTYVGTEATSYPSSSTAPTNAGTYTVTATYASDNANYEDASSSAVPFTISRKNITITAINRTVTYGADDTSLDQGYTVSSGSLASGDLITSVTLSTTDPTSTSGNYDATTGTSITASNATGTGGFNATNYNISYDPGTLVVGQLGLTVAGLTASKTYDGTTTGGITIDGGTLNTPIADDIVNFTYGSAAFGSVDAGENQTVNFSGFGLTGADAGNYSLSQPSAITTGVINRAIVTITAKNQTTTYGTADTTLDAGFTVAGALASTDSVTGVTLSTTDPISTSGNYDAAPGTSITASNAEGTGGFNATNYNISYASGLLSVNVLPVRLTGTRAQDGTNLAAAGILTVTNEVSGDNLALSGSAALAGAGPGTQSVTSFGGLTLGGTSAGNYTLTGASGSVTVNAAAVYITPSSDSVPVNATIVTINGSGFSSQAANDHVTLTGGTAGIVTAVSTTQLKVAVTHLVVGTLAASVTVTGVGSSTMTQVATVIPVVTASTTTKLAANATTLSISGLGFSTTGNSDVVTLSSGRVTAVTATATELTVSVSDLLAGVLSASVAVNGVSSGAAAQVAIVKPVVTLNTTNPVLASATSVTINGFGFTAGTTVTLKGGTAGTVTVVSANQLTVAVTKLLAGSLSASVSSSGVSGGTAVQVATVSPVVAPSSAPLNANGVTARTLTINGNGFTTGSRVTLTGGTAGTVTVMSSTQLKVSVANLVAGGLTASVTSSGESSGAAVQVATVVPALTSSTASLAATATATTTLNINGFGFSTTLPVGTNNAVTFTNSQGGTFTGTVTTATATKLTVTLSGLIGTLPAGALDATITSSGESGAAAQVAIVKPVITLNTTNPVLASATSVTINGFGFTAGTTVTLKGGTAGTVTVVSANQLTVAVTKLLAGSLSAVGEFIGCQRRHGGASGDGVARGGAEQCAVERQRGDGEDADDQRQWLHDG